MISVMGAGAWGTAFAVHLARNFPSCAVRLYMRDAQAAGLCQLQRENVRYLAGVRFPENIQCLSHLADALNDPIQGLASLLVLALPSQALAGTHDLLRRILMQRASELGYPVVFPPIILLSKGFDKSAHTAVDKIAEQSLDTKKMELPGFLYEAWQDWPSEVMVLSGPNFAKEIAQGLPAAATLAASSLEVAERWVEQLHSGSFRLYASDDRAGVSFGGAAKNVLAIAAGLSDGLHLGHNARASLITRGLSELMELAQRMGCRPTTLFGLAGLGDVLLTCTGDLSRNRQVGLKLAEGLELSVILQQLGHVAEGVYAAASLIRLADYHGCAMPLCRAVESVLSGRLSPTSAVDGLLSRNPRPEWTLPLVTPAVVGGASFVSAASA